MTNMQPFRIALLAGCLLAGSIARSQSAAAPAAPPARPTPPTRPADGPGAPAFTAITGKGANAPVDKNGDFVIGPDYAPAPEREPVESIPHGKLQQFTMESKDSKFYPGIARDVFGTVDPNNPKTLIVATHAQDYQRTITVYVPAQYKKGAKAPFIVIHDGPEDRRTRCDAGARVRQPHRAEARAGADCDLDPERRRRRARQPARARVRHDVGQVRGIHRGRGAAGGGEEREREAHAQARWPRGHGLQLGRGGGVHDGLVSPRVVPPHRQLLRHVREPAVAVQPETPGGAWGYHESIIANSKPKPIRIWMHVGDRDLYNPNVMRDDMHDWVVANHRMAKVFKDKGYQYQYVYALDSGHCDRKVREQTLPQALEWVWRGYK